MKISKKKIFIILGVVIVVIVIILSFSKKDKIEYITTELKKTDLTQTVSEVGAVKANKEIDLNFLQSGRLSNIKISVGDQVEEGQVLAELDYSSLLIKKEEVLAALKIAEANKEKLVKGASYDEIKILEAQVSQAKNAYESAEKDLEQTKKIVAENILQAEKTLSDLKAPNSVVPLSIKQAVESAKTNLSNTQRTGQQNIDNAYNSLINSLDYNLSVGRSALDAVKRIVDDENIENVFSVKNSYYKDETEKEYTSAVSKISTLEQEILFLKANKNKDIASKTSDDLALFLGQVFKSLSNCFNALENTIISADFPQTSLDSFKTSVSSHITYVNSAISSNLGSISSLSTAILSYETSMASAQDAVLKSEVALSDAITSAENSLSLLKVNSEQQILLAKSKLDSSAKSYDVYKLQLSKLKSPARSEDLKLVQAQVDQANSTLGSIDKQIEENLLKAPIKGKVVKINYEVGEQVNASKPFLVLLTENDFEIELFISESDISKVKIDNQAEITFDAFGNDYKVYGSVYFIEPASTSISDVIYYKTKIIFSDNNVNDDNYKIKPGMTANVTIISNKKENVFAVPFRSIINKEDGSSIVRVLNGGKKIKEVAIEIGMSGDQAMVEISSDELKEGDKIVTSVKNGK